MGGADLTITNEIYAVTVESFDSIASFRHKSEHALRWVGPFVLPEWLRVWWSEFGSTPELYLCSVRQRNELIGIAPLMVKADSASFIGGTNVCDYLDFIVTAGKEGVFFDALLDHLDQQGIKYLELGLLRPD